MKFLAIMGHEETRPQVRKLFKLISTRQDKFLESNRLLTLQQTLVQAR
jgi:hypothetical protein